MKRALISVADKANLEVALKSLSGKYEIISTGSTANLIKELGYEVTKVSDVINFEEILGGRVKTLHPNIHGAILSRRHEADNAELKKHNIIDIDVVICNLYPFEQTITSPNVELAEAIENIDIGGVTLLRAAAKNFKHVQIICNPNDYGLLADEIDEKTRSILAAKAFEHTAYYDTLISSYLKSVSGYENDELLVVGARKKKDLRYGENSHQKATYFEKVNNESYSLNGAEVLHGKELSYNNIKDIDAALNLIGEFKTTAAVALKHNTPCGVGVSDNDLNKAFDRCYDMDSISIFGGIVAFNTEVDETLANKLNKIFLEVIIAPNFEQKALEILKQKQNVRIIKAKMDQIQLQKEIISVNGGFLVQDKDQNDIFNEACDVVTVKSCDDAMKKAAINAQVVCKYVKSNAIVVANKDQIIAQGGGQTSRIDAAKIALEKAKLKGYTKDLIIASDAFFPFCDVAELAAKYGVTTLIQPGGSIRDAEVIEKCDELELTMMMTKVRHFKH